MPIDSGSGPVAPSRETVEDGTYQPLSRPLFIYVNAEAAQRPEIQKFVEFSLKSSDLVAEVGYVPLPAQAYTLAQENFTNRKTGSVFATQDTIGVAIEDLLQLEAGQ